MFGQDLSQTKDKANEGRGVTLTDQTLETFLHESVFVFWEEPNLKDADLAKRTQRRKIIIKIDSDRLMVGEFESILPYVCHLR